ncbi:16262_t:CDS:2 [Dentiscutata erythropus]|uniref:16262_t:CDS:1 n=1 Tax=Dentiscutata erythropus TaxID=1348616 RepID=A0A9N8ZDL6_9GLOM|nr:16262_t:CDS:2 [Dentiscutata erythropus]
MIQNQSTPHSEINFEHQSTLVSDANENTIPTKNINDQEAQTVENDASILHGIELFLVTFGLGCAMFVAALDQTIVATAMPKIGSDFNGLDQVAWIATSYLLTVTSFQPIYGKLSDIFGRKVTFLFAITIFELGSLLCGLSANMVSMIIFRAIAGIGGGGIVALVMIIVSEIVSTKDRGKYQGIIGMCYGIASIVGPLLGGAFTDHVSWRWCFFINLPLGVITILAVCFFLRMEISTSSLLGKLKRIDFMGIIMMIVSTVCILLPLNWGGSTYAWNNPVIIVLLCVGAVGYIIFGLVESYVVFEPITPPIQSGLELIPYLLSVVIFLFLTGQLFSLTDKISYQCVTLLASALAIISGGLTTMWKEDTGYGELIGFMIISGAGVGTSFQTVTLCIQGLVENKDLASVTALLLFFRSIGGIFGIAVSETVFNNKLLQELSTITLPSYFSTQSAYTIQLLPPDTKSFVIQAYVSGFQFIFYFVILYSALMFISSLLMGNSKPKYDDSNVSNEKIAAFE